MSTIFLKFLPKIPGKIYAKFNKKIADLFLFWHVFCIGKIHANSVKKIAVSIQYDTEFSIDMANK